ncbi:LysR family transcriptional regulator [Ilumatobacter nonamiensis]|uniref:LysR family transcriptional regulator n=1 Tax=Ilumatobacter nonamiensis TaxID=467093 RepID=UPI00034DB33C|nr:LysR family transcriptional regulator [Ilumatobacter nonamiensis]
MPLQLDLRHYETIVAIVELGTMTEAAKALYSTQSTLSHRLAEAERRLGVRLFDRGRHRRLTPTRAGIATHQAAARALDELGRNEQVLLAERSNVTSVVRIGVGSYDCFHWYPSFLGAASRHLPDVELELVVVGDAPGDVLASGDTDLVIAPGAPAGSIELIPAFEDELVLVTAPDHRLVGREFIEPIDLVDETYLTYNFNPTPGFEYDRFIRTGDDYPRVVSVVPQTSAITELVAAGAGVSILSRWALDPAIATGRLAATRCGPDGLALAWSLLTRATESADSPTRRVADHLADHLATSAT